jgi:serine/threonine-protein kinase
LYERARELEPGARAAFVGAEAGETPSLRDEVLSLLDQTEAAEEFFERLSVALPARPPQHPNPELLIAQAIGHYEIREQIGAGGMGAVYRAHDTRLDRDVALKFLPPHLTADPEARERLLAEARAAAALEHPNVCTVYEIGETEDGRPFIAMALCEGETLKERLERGPLPPAEAVRVATQLTQGLSAAHARGILHRDVKPGNIVLTTDGSVKLVDFGLARMVDATLTRAGRTPGTLAYMSPEQVRGEPLDPRTDLWSLGVVLYEMLSGVRPFGGANDRALIEAILHPEPGSLSNGQPEVPRRLAHIIERLLRKDRNDRYGSADELLADLAAATRLLEQRRIARPLSRRIAVGAVVVLGVAIPLYTLRSTLGTAGSSVTADAVAAGPALAVLPFTTHGQGLEVWREGMVDLLSKGLDGAGGLRAIDSRTLLARWNEAVGTDAVADLGHSLDVARRARANYALVGSAITAGSQVRFAADVYDLESGRSLGQAVAEGPPDSIFSIVDRLAMETLAVVFEEDHDDLPSIDLAAVTTSSLPALKAYLNGEVRFRRGELVAAVEAWERAVRADTLFALAYYGLSEAYGWEPIGDYDNYRQNLDRARRLADRLPAREADMVRVRWSQHEGEPESLAAAEEAVRRYPDHAEAWYNLGEVYYHRPGAMRGPEEAERAFRRAAELQPASALYRAHLVDLAFRWRPDSARVGREVEAYGRLAPTAVRTRAGRIAFALAFGDSGARAEARAALDTLGPESATMAYEFLVHSRFAQEREAVKPAIVWRRDALPTWTRFLRFHSTGAADGQVRQALAFLDDAGTPDLGRDCGRLHLSVRGLPVPGEIVEERLTSSHADSSALESRLLVACAAGYAAERGRWREHAELLAHARKMVRRELAAGDSASAERWQMSVREAEAHGLWRRGRKEEALHVFESLLWGDTIFGARGLWYVGGLAYELGQLDLAERAFRALWHWDGPAAQLYLGRIYERTGRTTEALEAYEQVIYGWRNADPELQPLVDEARRAITRLSGAED